MDAINYRENAQLFQLLNVGNRLAFNEIVNRYWQKLYTYTYYISKDTGLTEDIIQELFIKLWENREPVDVEKHKFYLFDAYRNNAISQLRKVRLSNLKEGSSFSISNCP